MRSLISTFVLCYLESIISKLATCKIKVNILASLCSCADLVEHYLVRNIKDRFSSIKTHIILNFLFPIRIYHECEDRIGKIHPEDRRLTSGDPEGQIIDYSHE